MRFDDDDSFLPSAFVTYWYNTVGYVWNGLLVQVVQEEKVIPVDTYRTVSRLGLRKVRYGTVQ
jgi:hypothetical protein